MTGLRRDVLAVIFLIVLITVFFSTELFGDRSLITFRLVRFYPWRAEATPEQLQEPSVTSDCVLSYYPRRVFATRMMRDGKIPLWNPYQFCGTPFLANYQSGVLYPVNLGMYWVDPPQQMDLFLYIHFLIAALFTFLLARRLGVSPGGALVSALAFTFCGFMATRYGQPTFVSTASWIPALLYFGGGLVSRPSLKRTGYLAAALAMCILAGFPQLVFLAVYTLVLYIVLRVLLQKGSPRRRRTVALGLLAFSVLAAGLVCAFQLVPTYELSTFSYRKALPYEMILSSAHHPLVALKYFIPDILGNPRDLEVGVLSNGLARIDSSVSFNQNYVSTIGYVGVLPFLLALLGIVKPRRNAVPFIVLGLIALAAVFGTPLLRLFYSVLPGFKFSRIDRIIVIYMLSMSVLAGFGVDSLRHKGRDGEVREEGCSARRALIAASAFGIFAAVLGVWLGTSGAKTIVRAAGDAVALDVFRAYAMSKVGTFLMLAGASAAFVILAALKPLSRRTLMIIAVVLILVDLLPFASRFKVSQPDGEIMPESKFVETLPAKTGRSRIVRYAADILPPSTPMLLEIDDVQGYNALNVDHFIEVLGVMDSTLIATENAALRRRIGPFSSIDALNSPLLDMLNAAYILTLVRMEGGIQPVRVGNDGVLPRAYLVGGARFFGTYEEVLGYMKRGVFDPASEVLLVGEGAAVVDTAGDIGGVLVSQYEPQEIVMEAVARRDSYLFISDTYYPGWKAYIDGIEVPLLRADYAFRAVAVSPGEHRIRMVFEPGSFRVGVILSIAGLVLLAVLLVSGSADESL
jgi:hypothetical protein